MILYPTETKLTDAYMSPIWMNQPMNRLYKNQGEYLNANDNKQSEDDLNTNNNRTEQL